MAETEGVQAGKRYYWLKLQDGFFGSKRIKKLRKLAGGDTYTIIYLKMQLLAIKTDGILRWTGLEDDFASELALDLDEEPDNVEVTLRFLLAHGLAETRDGTSFFLPYAVENTGSETSAAKRMRDMRARNGVTLQGNIVTLPSNGVTQERNKVTQASQCDAAVTPALRDRYGEKEIEIEKESEREKEITGSGRAHAQELSRVMNFFMDRINPTPSPYCVDLLKSYTKSLGADVVLHALGIALDERKTGWSYIQAILQRYERDGLKTMDAVLRDENERADKKETKSPARPAKPNQIVGSKKSKFSGQELSSLLDGLERI